MSKILGVCVCVGGGLSAFSCNFHKTDRRTVIIVMCIGLHFGTVSEPYLTGNMQLNSAT